MDAGSIIVIGLALLTSVAVFIGVRYETESWFLSIWFGLTAFPLSLVVWAVLVGLVVVNVLHL